MVNLISMVKLIFSSILLMLYLSWSKAFSFVGTQITAISPSKHSIILNHGLFKGHVLGDKFLFYKSLKSNNKQIDVNQSLDFDEVGLGEIVKISEDKAYLYFNKKIKVTLKVNDILYYSPNFLKGRKIIDIKNKDVVLSANEEDLSEIPKDIKNISKIENEYEAIDVDLSSKNKSVADAVKTNFTKFRKWPFKSVIGKSAVDIYEPKNLSNSNANKDYIKSKSLKKRIKSAIYLAEQRGVISKYKKEKYGLVGLYQKTARDDESFQSSHQNVYQKLLDEKRSNEAEAYLDSNTRVNIDKNGARFTNSMSDKQIRRYFIDTGIQHELKRQSKALNELNSSEIRLYYINGLSSHVTAADPLNQNLNFAVGLSYEYHLASIKQYLSKFSLEVGLLQESTNFDISGINGKFSEGNFSMYLNWFFSSAPSTIDTFIPFLSLGFKRGSSVVSSSKLTKSYRYQVTGLPSWKLGFKYRFKAGDTREELLKFGMGFNTFVESTKKYFTVIDQLNDSIFSTMNYNEIRIGMGFSVYF